MRTHGGYSAKFCTEMLRPEVEHFTFLHTTVLTKKVPLSYTASKEQQQQQQQQQALFA